MSRPIRLIYTSWSNPYNPWQTLPMKFYQELNFTDCHINSLSELNDSLFDENAENFLVIRKADFEKKGSKQIIDSFHFAFLIQSVPSWQEYLNKTYKGFNNFDILMLYRKEK
jgi:hypothetical protein